MLQLLLLLVIAKIVALALTISSGGSGGVFAPGLFVGAMLGGVFAQVFHQPDAAFVIVGMAAVFAGAARVPIATLLMVTEMTGGYTLLVPAALAITVAYLVQERLSLRVKYPTLYEGQVEGRSDSPAHHAEHLKAAMRLLSDRQVTLSKPISHLDVRTLLEMGIPVDLPGNKQLVIGTLKPDSQYVGRLAESCCSEEHFKDVDLLAIFRDKQMLIHLSDIRFQAGDRLLLIVSPEMWKEQAKHFQ